MSSFYQDHEGTHRRERELVEYPDPHDVKRREERALLARVAKIVVPDEATP